MKQLFACNFEQYFAVLIMIDLVVRFLEQSSLYTYVFYCISVIAMASMIKPGLRNVYWISYILYLLIYLPNFILEQFEYEIEYMQSVSGILYLIIGYLICFEGQYYFIEPEGEYGIGRREKIIKKDGYSLTLSIFYPIDKEFQKQNMYEKTKTALFFISGFTGADALAPVLGIPYFLLYQLLVPRLQSIDDAKLHKDFEDGEKKLTPIIASHGLMWNRHSFASHINELVSFGCIVYSWCHTDRTAPAYTDHSVDPPKEYGYEEWNEEKHKISQEKYRQNQLDIRVNKDIASIIELIKDEAKPDFLPCIDTSKMSILGHSMGGMTAVEAAKTYSEDIKLCVTMDIYFKARHEDIMKNDNYFIPQPLCIISSELFHKSSRGNYKDGYNSQVINDKFYENTIEHNGSKKNYNVVVPSCSHNNQTDGVLFMYKTYQRTGIIPKESDPEEIMIKHSRIIVGFIAEHGFLPLKYPYTVKDVIKA